MWGIDCPENGQPFRARAKQFTSDLAFGKTATVKVRDIDRYKRIVAEITLPDGRNLGHEIVRGGLGWWYERYAKRDGVLPGLEAEARKKRHGLWGDAKPVPPWEWRTAGAVR